MEGYNNFEMVAAYADTTSHADSLLRFNAVAVNNKMALLTWRTSTGGDTREFIIQRSTPNSAWVTLDSVAVKSKDSGTARYRYVDPSPQRGINEYRLMLINDNGSSSLSSVQQVRIKGPRNLALFPNPARSNLLLIADPGITGVISLYTESGQLVRQQYMSGTELNLPLTNLPAGVYHLVIKESDGTVEDRHILHVN
jgi:hypothetical protein